MTHTFVTFSTTYDILFKKTRHGWNLFYFYFLKIIFRGPKAIRVYCRLEIWHVFGRRHHTPGHTMRTSMHLQNSAVMHTFWHASYTFGSLLCDILIVILGRSGGVRSPVSPNTLNSYGVSGYDFLLFYASAQSQRYRSFLQRCEMIVQTISVGI